MRLPRATTVSAATMKPPFSSSRLRSTPSARSAFSRERRRASALGRSPLRGDSSTSLGNSASGSTPICCSSAKRRGDAEASTSFGRQSFGSAAKELSGLRAARAAELRRGPYWKARRL